MYIARKENKQRESVDSSLWIYADDTSNWQSISSFSVGSKATVSKYEKKRHTYVVCVIPVVL